MEKKFDRMIRESGLERFKFHVVMQVEVGDQHPGWAHNNVESVLMTDLEKKLGIRVNTLHITSCT